MIICPVQNGEKYLLNWIQTRPRISQDFGENPAMYAQFGLNGHNGLDLAVPVGTQLFAPIEGMVSIGNDGNGGYGKYIEIIKDNLKVILGHLSEFDVKDGQYVYMCEKVGLSGNTGFSTGPHLHLGMKNMKDGKVLNYDNGFKGAINPRPLIVTWKGGFDKYSL